MDKKRERPNIDRRCRALKYAEKASRLLDERYFDDIADAVYNNKKGIFMKICIEKLGISEEIADDLWNRITYTEPPKGGCIW